MDGGNVWAIQERQLNQAFRNSVPNARSQELWRQRLKRDQTGKSRQKLREKNPRRPPIASPVPDRMLGLALLFLGASGKVG
jgi:hypothetical protein